MSNPVEPVKSSGPVGSSNKQANQWGMFVHLSQLAMWIVPVFGVAIPIVLWQLKKDEFPIVNEHGKVVTNWIINSVIYFCICLVLIFVGIGLLLIPVLALVSAIFAIIGGIKANDGVVWEYPGTLLKVFR